jgi:hypothetical protein
MHPQASCFAPNDRICARYDLTSVKSMATPNGGYARVLIQAFRH